MLGMISTNNRGLDLVTCIVLFCVVAVSGIQGNTQEKPTYYIDVAAVVDYSVYKKFLTEAGSNKTAAEENIREYYAFIFDGVDQRYQSIAKGYTIRIFLSDVMVLNKFEDSPFSRKDIDMDSEEAMLKFQIWITDYRFLIDKYDLVMLFTVMNLKSKKPGVYHLGVSYSSSICLRDVRSLSIIMERNDYESIIPVAHELGHSLSAFHDGDNNNCSSTEGYIMSAYYHYGKTGSTMKQPWQFSTCSLKNFTSFFRVLHNLGETCQTDIIHRASNIPNVSGRLLGQEIQPDQQCQLSSGPSSGYLRSIANKGSIMCNEMQCYDATSTKITQRTALDGTTCGNLKICRFGQCVSDPRAPKVEEICMFGDLPAIIDNGMTCPQLVKHSPAQCYNVSIQQLCCKSCQAAVAKRQFDDAGKVTTCLVCLPRQPLLSGCEYGERRKDNTSLEFVCFSNARWCCYLCIRTNITVHSEWNGDEKKWTWLLPLIFILIVVMIIFFFCCR